MSNLNDLYVGRVIYLFDPNRRIYVDSKIVYSKCFKADEVVDENRKSWILKSGHRIPKNLDWKTFRYDIVKWFTYEGMVEDIWLNNNRANINHALMRDRSNDSATYKEIAKLIGYTPIEENVHLNFKESE